MRKLNRECYIGEMKEEDRDWKRNLSQGLKKPGGGAGQKKNSRDKDGRDVGLVKT